MITNTSRYAPGGDIFAQIDSQHGREAATRLYSLALLDDNKPFLNYLSDLNAADEKRQGVGTTAQLTESTASALGSQLWNDPLGAPIEQLGKVVQNTTKAALGNWGIWIVGAGSALALFFYFGGSAVVRSAIKRKAA
jgi:hypothetical protein